MRINKVLGSEAGEYECTASNEAGSTKSTASLIVNEVPSIIMDPKGSVTLEVGTKLTVSCSATGDPTPTISWKRIKSTCVLIIKISL